MDIEAWLHALGLDKLVRTFRDNGIDMDILTDITEADLTDLGVRLGDRKRIMRGIAALDAPAPSATRGAAPASAEGASETERRYLTVMFVDLVGSTHLASVLDPEEMRDLIRSYQNAVAGEISRFDGYVAKFMGDGVLCYFGFPIANENDAERAVRAGQAIVDTVARITTAQGDAAAVRIGIASGLVVVGDVIGEGEARERDVIGETPNVAARLQSVADPNQIIVADATAELVQKVARMDEVQLPLLKGVRDDLRAYRVTGLHGTGDGGSGPAKKVSALVGRTAELDQLAEAWADVVQGAMRPVLLTGDAGIGKTHLATTFCQRLSLASTDAIYLSCSPFHRQTALYPIIQHIRQDAGIGADDSDDTALDKLESLLAQRLGAEKDAPPIVANLLGLKYAHRLGKLEMGLHSLRARTLDILVQYLLGSRPEAPRLLVVEDIHWLDDTTAEALSACIDAAAAARVLFLFVGRPDPPATDLGTTAHLKIHLGRLEASAVRSMIHDLAGGKQVAEPLVAEIVSKTDGVPLFVEELTKTVLHSDAVTETDSSFDLAGPVSDLAIPSSLHASLMARLDRMSTAKQVAQTAACIGRSFDRDVLAEVMGDEPGTIASALDELVQAELLEPPGPDTPTYSFRHALMCETAYESLLKSKRRDLHRRIAEHLQRRDAAPETLAHHHEQAGNWRPAAACLLRAGQSALRICAATEAIGRFQRGIDLLERQSFDAQDKLLKMRLCALLGTGFMLSKSWGAKEVEDAYSLALELVDETDDLVERIWIIWGAWVFRQVSGQVRASQNEAQRAMQIARDSGDNDALLVANVIMLQAAFYEGRWQDALDHGAEIERLYDPARHADLKDAYSLDLLLCWYVHGSQANWMLGRFEQAADQLARAEAMAADIDHAHSRAWVAVWGANLHLLNDAPDRVLAALPGPVQQAETFGFDYVAKLGQLILGAARLATDTSNATLADYDDAIARFRSTGAGIAVPYFLSHRARALVRAGRNDEALTSARVAVDTIADKGETWAEPLAHLALGESLAAEGRDLKGAQAALDTAVASARDKGAALWQLEAELARLRLARRTGADRDRIEALHAALLARAEEIAAGAGASAPARLRDLITDLRTLPADL